MMEALYHSAPSAVAVRASRLMTIDVVPNGRAGSEAGPALAAEPALPPL